VPQTIAIIDYSLGNLHSIVKKLEVLKAGASVCADAGGLAKADKIILPGIGHFGTAVQQLRSTGLIHALNEAVLHHKKPVLGICLGMQLMAKTSDEAPGFEGLNWLNASVVRFRQEHPHVYRTPHTGWNQCRIIKENPLLPKEEISSELFYCHSFHLADVPPSWLSAETSYGYSFAAAIHQNHIFGVQFHPEKSHKAGLKIFENFLSV
jgi:imidazole glycerol-phosphate synthase subunit HisH